jgi:hypothetical protein
MSGNELNEMNEATELTALRALTFNWARGLEEVWAPSPYHVQGLHSEIVELVARGIGQARTSAGTNPLGIVLRGERGVGKTHLLGWVRQEMQRNGGYFFLVSVSSGKDVLGGGAPSGRRGPAAAAGRRPRPDGHAARRSGEPGGASGPGP